MPPFAPELIPVDAAGVAEEEAVAETVASFKAVPEMAVVEDDETDELDETALDDTELDDDDDELDVPEVDDALEVIA